jgi:hypothetical protein
MSGSGMKQGRQARGGSKRVERLRKPEGASGWVRQTQPRCCCRERGHAEGERNLMGGAASSDRTREGAVAERRLEARCTLKERTSP